MTITKLLFSYHYITMDIVNFELMSLIEIYKTLNSQIIGGDKSKIMLPIIYL